MFSHGGGATFTFTGVWILTSPSSGGAAMFTEVSVWCCVVPTSVLSRRVRSALVVCW